MSSEYLMRFLDIGAIDLKGDDSRLEKLRATAKDLSAVLKKAPAKTASFTMVAADPGVASDDPTIQEAMAALRKQWETVSNAFSSPPWPSFGPSSSTPSSKRAARTNPSQLLS